MRWVREIVCCNVDLRIRLGFKIPGAENRNTTETPEKSVGTNNRPGKAAITLHLPSCEKWKMTPLWSTSYWLEHPRLAWRFGRKRWETPDSTGHPFPRCPFEGWPSQKEILPTLVYPQCSVWVILHDLTLSIYFYTKRVLQTPRWIAFSATLAGRCRHSSETNKNRAAWRWAPLGGLSAAHLEHLQWYHSKVAFLPVRIPCKRMQKVRIFKHPSSNVLPMPPPPAPPAASASGNNNNNNNNNSNNNSNNHNLNSNHNLNHNLTTRTQPRMVLNLDTHQHPRSGSTPLALKGLTYGRPTCQATCSDNPVRSVSWRKCTRKGRIRM